MDFEWRIYVIIEPLRAIFKRVVNFKHPKLYIDIEIDGEHQALHVRKFRTKHYVGRI